MSTFQAAYITAYMDLARPPDSNRPSLVDRTGLAERLPVSDEGPRDWSHLRLDLASRTIDAALVRPIPRRGRGFCSPAGRSPVRSDGLGAGGVGSGGRSVARPRTEKTPQYWTRGIPSVPSTVLQGELVRDN
jgi:hypothetical protein